MRIPFIWTPIVYFEISFVLYGIVLGGGEKLRVLFWGGGLAIEYPCFEFSLFDL